MSRLVSGATASFVVIDADYLDRDAGVIVGARVDASITDDVNLLAIMRIDGAEPLTDPYIVHATQLRPTG